MLFRFYYLSKFTYMTSDSRKSNQLQMFKRKMDMLIAQKLGLVLQSLNLYMKPKSRHLTWADRLCLLWKITACYFLLVIYSLLCRKIVGILFVILTNNREKNLTIANDHPFLRHICVICIPILLYKYICMCSMKQSEKSLCGEHSSSKSALEVTIVLQ